MSLLACSAEISNHTMDYCIGTFKFSTSMFHDPLFWLMIIAILFIGIPLCLVLFKEQKEQEVEK